MVMGWFKIIKGKWWNKNKLYVTMDIAKLHNETQHSEKVEAFLKTECLSQISRYINRTYTDIRYGGLIKKKRNK